MRRRRKSGRLIWMFCPRWRRIINGAELRLEGHWGLKVGNGYIAMLCYAVIENIETSSLESIAIVGD
jgi:hypothetical protein